MIEVFPEDRWFGTVLCVSGFWATLALFYLGDGRGDWWFSGALTVYTTQWGSAAIRAWKAHWLKARVAP